MLNEDTGILVSDASPTTAISTLTGLLLESSARFRKPDAFRFKRNGHWISVSTDEFLLRVEELFFALQTLGIKPGERVAIISENRLEWAITDYAALCAGAITVPIYPTLSGPQIEALLRDCDPACVFVSTSELLDKVLPARGGLPIRHIVAFDAGIHRPDVMRIDALYETGRQSTYDYPAEFRRSARAVDPNSVATIIYTSGTTGIPKGAMLTHRNLVSNVIATGERLPLRSTDVSLSFLPLSHIFQRHVDYASMRSGVTTAYGGSIATVAEDMLEVHPTFAAGVPRFFEKVYGQILSEVSRSSSALRSIFDSALSVGRDRLRTGKSSLAHRVANRFVFRKIRHGLGGRIQFFISGGAALANEIEEFFWSVGIPIYEGYGLSETSPVITLNGPGNARLGTVGRRIGDQEIRIAQDGEILVRGSNVMKGYYHMERETAEAFTEGWFHTGDIGKVDSDGFLKITDRKKDLIITSSGKNVAPQSIENQIKVIPYFENVIVVGEGRSFICALIVPNYHALAVFARAHKIAFENPRQLIDSPQIYDLAMAEIASRTKDLAPFEKIRKIAFVEQDFTIAGGELTPTMKIRRSAIEKKYKSVIDQLYAS
jgi:long-chain acyl-CoA synthetase